VRLKGSIKEWEYCSDGSRLVIRIAKGQSHLVPDCHDVVVYSADADPVEEKPVGEMSIEECAEEIRQFYPPGGYASEEPDAGWHVYGHKNPDNSLWSDVAFDRHSYPTCVQAWRAAVRALRNANVVAL